MRGLQQIDDVAKYIPGLSLAQREPGGTTLVFRGVASSGIQFGGVSSSALYLDEQPITQSGRSPDPRFIDIERIEALRGPQGTLYGASSQSGTLRVITNKPDPSGFDAWAEAQVTDVQDGGTGYDVSAMVNIPLAEDRVALRLVGFAAEDAGYIDNVLSDSPGGTFDNADVVEEDVNSVETTARARRCASTSTRTSTLTFGLLYQDLTADGHGDVSEGVGDLNQVRFEEESLDDEWYQASLTVNAGLPFADLVIAASYFDRKFAYQADATDYEFTFNESGYVDLRFRRRPARLRDEPRKHAHHDRRGTAAVQRRCREPLVLAGRHLLQQGGRPHVLRQLRPRLPGHARIRLLQLLPVQPDWAARSARPRTGFSAVTRPSSSSAPSSARSASTSPRTSPSRPAAAGSNTTAPSTCTRSRRRASRPRCRSPVPH